ncbi:MAG: hypothetical protein ABFD82_20800 [Syntrophaceae bacterium]
MEKENEKNLIRINDYLVLSLNSYNGTFSILEGNIGREDGKYHWYPCSKEIQGKKKTVPVSVRLGDKAKAKEVLLWALKIITGKEFQEIP